MNRFTLLTLAVLLIFSVFGTAYAQYASVDLSEGTKPVNVSEGSIVHCTLAGDVDWGYLYGECFYDGPGGGGELAIDETIPVAYTSFEADNDVAAIHIEADRPEYVTDEYYRIQWTLDEEQ